MNIHLHKPSWHTITLRAEHLVHDPRFWAAVALTVLVTLMILAMLYAKPGETFRHPVSPIYPYAP